MIKQVPLDYMHLVCLGIMKKLLTLWTKGNMAVRLKPDQLKEASLRSISIRKCIPKEFARLPRNLDEIDRWKATEFRLFLLYTGPVILKDLLPKNMYVHLLCLSIGVRILSDNEYCLQLNEYADCLLRYFAKKFSVLYGLKYISYNVHNIIHLSKDVLELGPLDSFSAFEFENYMYTLKKKLKHSGCPLEQLTNRLSEEILLEENCESKSYPEFHYDKEQNIKSVDFKEFSISLKVKDSCCLLTDDTVVIIDKINKNGNAVTFNGRKFLSTSAFFTTPCDSREFGISKVSFGDFSESVLFSKSDVKRKCVLIKLFPEESADYVVFPLIHTV